MPNKPVLRDRDNNMFTENHSSHQLMESKNASDLSILIHGFSQSIKTRHFFSTYTCRIMGATIFISAQQKRGEELRGCE